MHRRWLFVASCFALITSAFSFMIRQDITDPLAADFAFTKQDVGTVMGAAFLGMAVAMFVVAPLCDWLGMKRVLLLAWLCHCTGILGTIFAAQLTHVDAIRSVVSGVVSAVPESVLPVPATNTSFWVLWISTFLVGSGNGLVEIAINPLAATLFPTEKTHFLNILHAWWPGGLIMSGLLALYVVNPLLGLKAADVTPDASSLGWKVKVGLVLVPLVIYGLMCLGQKFPVTERVQHNVSTGEMFLQALRPMFLLWGFCMLLTASTELGPNQWQESVLKRTANVSGTLIFVYTSGLMFVMRFFAGPLAHRLSPVGMLTVSALLSAAGLYWLSYAATPILAFAAATVFGIGIAYFWPTMLGVTAERFPKGGALLLGLMGCFGNIAIFQALPQMGAIYDSYTVANLPTDLKDRSLTGPDDKTVPVVKPGEPTWLPKAITEHIFPAGNQKLNPDAINIMKEKKLAADLARVEQAEAIGAAYAFRWVTVLPCILVVIFGLIAVGDKLRGGYRAVHISEGAAKAPAPL
jgi:MFS family permease